MPRAVLDANVLVSALISRSGPSARLLEKLRDGAFELIVSPHLLAELDGVLSRQKFRQYVTQDEVEQYANLIRLEAILVDDVPSVGTPVVADADDQYVVDLAHESRADWIVSGDQHLLGMRDVISVRTPREFLDSLD